ncbi:hypothetical protein [Rhizobium sp. BG4]|uniref:hypothetical protein n=1 Tax=Rhizobium sp. BG4 TaxID=2613770 RepID=UPI00193C9CFF|nr:hypothetical protein [Rhizobium sp. BG4]QRM44603.1 hypothetical protein F2982_14820 [Rhizobium sp. BG4]
MALGRRPPRMTLSIKVQSRGLIEKHLLQTLPPELEQVPIIPSPSVWARLSTEQQTRFKQMAPCIVRVVDDQT